MAFSHPDFRPVEAWTPRAVEKAIQADDADALLRAVVAVSMTDLDWRYAQNLCIHLSSHENANVRGNAVLGFGHIARVHGHLERARVQPIIRTALHDVDEFVRRQASCAIEDTAFFLNWNYPEKDKR